MKKTTLGQPKLCLACQMELNPFLDVNGKVVRPKEYCDSTCKEMYKMYHEYFRRGRILAAVNALKADIHRLRERPRIDLSV